MIRSFSDIITNSSSEVFIINVKEHDKVAEFLKDICDVMGYNINNIMEFDSATEDGMIDGWREKYKKGNLLIWSTDENSIPSIIMDLIENLEWDRIPALEGIDIRSVRRVHLG